MTDFIVSSSATGSGTGSLANPYTITQALAAGGAGNRFLFRSGVYLRSSPPSNILLGGAAGAGSDCVWMPYGDGMVTFRDNAVSTTHQPMFKLVSAAAGGSADYFTIDGRDPVTGLYSFEFDGNNYNGNMPFQVQSRHHFTMRSCYVHHAGGDGLGIEKSDYLYVFDNYFGWNGHPSRTNGSGISHDAFGAPLIQDTYDGFHSVFARNVITGSEGEPSDGNGFILDNGAGATAVGFSNTLIYGNVFGYNGNRGCHIFRCKPGQAGGKILVLGNTCLNNGLDLLSLTMINGNGSEFDIDGGSLNDGEADFASNLAIAVASTAGPGSTNFGTTPYRLAGTSAVIRSYANYYNGGTTTSAWASVTAGALPSSIATLNLRGGYPAVDTTQSQGHLNAPDPRYLASLVTPKTTSALVDAGVDIGTISGLTQNMLNDIATYAGIDISGHARPL